MDMKLISLLDKSELLSEGQVAAVIGRSKEAVEFTPEQRDVIARLEAYKYEFFNLYRTGMERFDDSCFVCVSGALGNYHRECSILKDAAGAINSPGWRMMVNLIGCGYGRKVPGIRNYPADRVPKSVAIEAVKSIFRMSTP